MARLPVDPVVEITDAGGGQLLIFGSAVPGNPDVVQPVHLWAMSGSKWQELDANGVGGV